VSEKSLLNTVSCLDIFDLCGRLQNDCIDMILADLPYGITACEWDNVIPFEPMWEAFKRIIKPRGAIVLTARQPFTTELISSNFDMFRYEQIWFKSLGTGYLNAKRQPMNIHENVLLFSDGGETYNPQMRKDKPYVATSGNVGGYIKDKTVGGYVTKNYGTRYPHTVIKINSQNNTQHPTQKPVALFEYLIRTYTQPGGVVFDPCVGSGTTAIAARNTARNFVVGDNSEQYVKVARKRLELPYTMPMFDDLDNSKTEWIQLEIDGL
jgi:site-specific DNA-methyltransferase (adenine-specific)